MFDIFSLVYSRLINNEQMEECLKGSGTTKNNIPSAFPHLYMKALGEPTTSSSLQNKQCAIQTAFEVTTYDSTSSTKARQLIFLATDPMQKMGFTVNYDPTETDRASTTETYRWATRFRKTCCKGGLI